MYLSIVIKSYNEAAKIARTLDSVFQAIRALPFAVEVILADSCSTDATVEIARQYPIRIVQFRHAEERGCGAGVQLGYQFAKGELIYFLDGDMELMPDYLPKAIAALEQDARLAGVAGVLEDTRVRNLVDQIRQKNGLSAKAGLVSFLNGGGLYKRRAIGLAGGYAADQNLKAFEEADLGLRLTAAGFKLLRLPIVAVRHTGHDADAFDLMKRHWKSRRAMAAGVFLRGALFRQHFWHAAYEQKYPLVTLFIWITAAAMSLTNAGFSLMLFPILFFVLIALVLSFKKRSFRHAGFSIIDWHYIAIAILVGMSYSRRDPTVVIDAVEVN